MVVVPLKSTSGTVKNLKNPDEMDMEEVGSFNSKYKPIKNYWGDRVYWVKQNEASLIRRTSKLR